MRLFKQKQQQQEKQSTDRVRTIDLNKVYVDKFGNEWFEYVNPLQLPAKRAIAAEIATRFAEMNLTKDMMLSVFAEMKKNANEGNIVALFGLLNELEFRLNFIGEEQTLLELATCYFVMGDEDETDFSDIDKRKKREVFDKDAQAKSFFLKGAFGYTMKFSSMSEVDILDYLIANAPSAERLERIMQERLSANTSMT